MDVVIILGCLLILMYLAWRGFSVILLAPACGLLAIALAGKPILPAYTELFMIKTVGFIKSYFPIFFFGSIFGQLMGDSGFARSIARGIVKKLGKGKALLSVVLPGVILTFGGVSLFVVTFAIYPFAAAIYKEAGIPKRFIPGAIVCGAFTATLGAFPGSPQIQNIIPATFYGSTIYASPGIGIVTGLVLFGACVFYMHTQHRKAAQKNEGYGEESTLINEPLITVSEDHLSNGWIAAIPIIVILGFMFYLNYFYNFDPALLAPYQEMKLPMVAKSINNVQSSWGLIVSLFVGSVLIIGLGWKKFHHQAKGVIKSLNVGTNGSIMAIMNTACLVGFGSIVSTSDGFKHISELLMGIEIGSTPLWSQAITINILAAITGSASGGVSIALDLMGQGWLDWAIRANVPIEVLTRVAAIASGGLSLTPHNGALITLFTVCGLTHKQAYKDVLILTGFKGAASFLAIILYTLFGNF